jgi:hypothetical protein
MDIGGNNFYPQERDWYLPPRIHRLRAQDFSRYGKFAHARLPYVIPIPKYISEHIFGENHERLGGKAELKLLQQLHELAGAYDVEICSDCESHLINPPFKNEYYSDPQMECAAKLSASF